MQDDEFDDLAQLSGVLSAHKFLLQNMYALVLAGQADPLGAVAGMAATLRTQFATLPSDGTSSLIEGEDERIRRHGLAYLDDFWPSIVARLEARTREKAPARSPRRH